jgi:hypothetical protein
MKFCYVFTFFILSLFCVMSFKDKLNIIIYISIAYKNCFRKGVKFWKTLKILKMVKSYVKSNFFHKKKKKKEVLNYKCLCITNIDMFITYSCINGKHFSLMI